MSTTHESLPYSQRDIVDHHPISAPRTNEPPRRHSEPVIGETDLAQLIRGKLVNATYQSGSPTLAFIPYAKLKEIWSDDLLARFLDYQQIELDEDQINTAKENLLRTISLLLIIRWTDWWRFKDIFFPADSNLACRRRDTNVLSFETSELADPSFLGGNDPDRIVFFLQKRWEYFPLKLKEGSQTEVHGDSRLPFIHEPEPCGCGAYGEVTKEVIARGQYMVWRDNRFVHLDEEITVARKRFPTKQYVYELRHLNLLRDAQGMHKRIVYDLGTLDLHGEVYILLPWANMDLKKFMEQDNGHVSLVTRLQGLIGEAAELAGALEFLHNGLQTSNGREAICHMDLKPGNILVFKDGNASWPGVWKITDFGISQTARIRSASRSDSDQADGDFYSFSPQRPVLRGTYSAPEPDTLPANDIWSFGCILVRVVAFGVGLQELEKLDRQRQKPDMNETDDYNDHFCRRSPLRLNSHVEAWIKSLPNRFSSGYSGGFGEKMRDLLLSMLAIEPSKRPNAEEVRSILLDLKNHFDEITTAAVPVSTVTGSASAIIVAESSPERQDSYQHLPTGSQSDRERPSPLNGQTRSASTPEPLQQLYSELRESQIQERPLIYAINQGYTSAIRALLDHEPDLDLETPDSSGVAPLVLAIRKGDEDMLKTLLEAPRAKDVINKLSPPGRTPLMEAARDGRVGMVSELLRRDARCDIVSTWDPGWTCLHYAVFNDTCDGELILAFKGYADFNKKPPSGKTPLMLFCSTFALYANNEERWRSKLNALLACGSKLDPKCTGEYPLEVAVRDEQRLLAEALHKKGAELPPNFPTRNLYLRSNMEKFVSRVQRSSVCDDDQQTRTRVPFLRRFSRG